MYDAEFVTIYENMKMKLYSYVLYKVRSQATAEDITSDVFVKLLKELQTKRDVLTYAQAWLYRVASNMIIDHHRNSYYKQTNTESEENASKLSADGEEMETELFVTEYNDILGDIAKEEQQKMVLESMRELKDDDQEVIELRLFQELPFKEIAVILESTESAVKMKYARAIEKLKVICEKTDAN